MMERWRLNREIYVAMTTYQALNHMLVPKDIIVEEKFKEKFKCVLYSSFKSGATTGAKEQGVE